MAPMVRVTSVGLGVMLRSWANWAGSPFVAVVVMLVVLAPPQAMCPAMVEVCPPLVVSSESPRVAANTRGQARAVRWHEPEATSKPARLVGPPSPAAKESPMATYWVVAAPAVAMPNVPLAASPVRPRAVATGRDRRERVVRRMRMTPPIGSPMTTVGLVPSVPGARCRGRRCAPVGRHRESFPSTIVDPG